MTIIGGVLLNLLCKGGFEVAAWLLLAIVPFFFVSVLAYLLITQLVTTTDYEWNGANGLFTKKTITNKHFRRFFGIPEADGEPIPGVDYTYVENPRLDEIVTNYNSQGEVDYETNYDAEGIGGSLYTSETVLSQQ